MPKVIAINSSPRGKKTSKTKRLLAQLIRGMREAGAAVEEFDLREHRIEYCSGCFSCWYKTPGQCCIEDDMTLNIFPKWKEADIAVYATPLYCHHMNAAMSTLRERCLPAALPFFEAHGERTAHPSRHKRPKSVWLATCGFPNDSEFALFSRYVRYADKGVLAEIYRSAAELMIAPAYKDKFDAILLALESAGREIITAQKISEETLAAITQPLDDTASISSYVNKHWENMLKKHS